MSASDYLFDWTDQRRLDGRKTRRRETSDRPERQAAARRGGLILTSVVNGEKRSTLPERLDSRLSDVAFRRLPREAFEVSHNLVDLVRRNLGNLRVGH
jgi:hypothetical protein